VARQNYSEQEAAIALLEGDAKALEYFFELYLTPLTYFGYKLTDDEAAAEDIAAESFVKLWYNCENLLNTSSIKAYLYKTVRNASIDHLRKKQSEKNRQSLLVPLQPVSEETTTTRIIETETYHQLYLLLETLPPKTGRVFKMFYLEGKSYREISEELSVSINTIKKQRIKAVQLIKQKLPKGFPLVVLIITLCWINN